MASNCVVYRLNENNLSKVPTKTFLDVLNGHEEASLKNIPTGKHKFFLIHRETANKKTLYVEKTEYITIEINDEGKVNPGDSKEMDDLFLARSRARRQYEGGLKLYISRDLECEIDRDAAYEEAVRINEEINKLLDWEPSDKEQLLLVPEFIPELKPQTDPGAWFSYALKRANIHKDPDALKLRLSYGDDFGEGFPEALTEVLDYEIPIRLSHPLSRFLYEGRDRYERIIDTLITGYNVATGSKHERARRLYCGYRNDGVTYRLPCGLVAWILGTKAAPTCFDVSFADMIGG